MGNVTPLYKSDPSGHLSADLAGHIARARAHLQARMDQLGLDPAQGWRIREEIRTGMTGTVIVLRPIHLALDAPDIETTVEVGQDGRAI